MEKAAHAAGHSIARVHATQVRAFARAKGQLAKTDAIDARTLADFAQVFSPRPLPQPEPGQGEPAAIVKYREYLPREITRTENLTETVQDKSLLALSRKTVAFLKGQSKHWKRKWPPRSPPRPSSRPSCSGCRKSKGSAPSPPPPWSP